MYVLLSKVQGVHLLRRFPTDRNFGLATRTSRSTFYGEQLNKSTNQRAIKPKKEQNVFNIKEKFLKNHSNLSNKNDLAGF